MRVIKKLLLWLGGLLVAGIGIFLFVLLVYQIEDLHDKGKPIYNNIATKGFDGGVFEVTIIGWALVFTAFLLIFLQLFKSLFDLSIKKWSDEAVQVFLNKFEKWVKR